MGLIQVNTISYLGQSYRMGRNTDMNKGFEQDLFDVRGRNSNFAKSLSKKSRHAIYEDENPRRGLLSLQNLQN